MADHPVHRFPTEELAQGFASHCTKRMWVMQDEEGFLVACPAKCAELEREGARYAEAVPTHFEWNRGLAL